MTDLVFCDIPATITLLSGLNFVDMAHGVDSTRIRAFGDDLGHERGATPCGTRIAFSMIF